MEFIIILPVLIFLAAMLYASVGHGGASGYLAAMALVGLAPLEMKPAALALNIFVAGIASYKYISAKRFSWSVFWPFAGASIPFAFLGGQIDLPGIIYKPIVGLVLLYSAFYFFFRSNNTDNTIQKARPALVLFIGSILGFLSGLVGVGGGIFLSPLLIMLHWETAQKVSGIAAAFILMNSAAALAGLTLFGTGHFPYGFVYWIPAAIVGGYLGAEYGSKHLDNPTIKRLLALVLLIAGIKMLVTATQ